MTTPSDHQDPAIGGVGPPLLRVVKGDPTPEELAALATVVAGLRAGSTTSVPRRRPRWGHPGSAHRREHRAGAGAWRASSLPG